MTPSEAEDEVWLLLLASLTGNSAIDAAVVRKFCDTNGVTAAQVMDRIHALRRAGPEQQRADKLERFRFGP
jgi:hypothetical protein